MHPCWNHGWHCNEDTKSWFTLSCTETHIVKNYTVFPDAVPGFYKTWIQFTALSDFFGFLLQLELSPQRNTSFLWLQTEHLNIQPLTKLTSASEEIFNTKEEFKQ